MGGGAGLAVRVAQRLAGVLHVRFISGFFVIEQRLRVLLFVLFVYVRYSLTSACVCILCHFAPPLLEVVLPGVWPIVWRFVR